MAKPTGESNTLGGMLAEQARAAMRPAVYEGRVSKVIGDRLEVTVRQLFDDARSLPARGHAPRVTQPPGGGVELVAPKRGDRVWVAPEGSKRRALVVVAWEPLG